MTLVHRPISQDLIHLSLGYIYPIPNHHLPVLMDLVLPQWRLGTQLGQRPRRRNKDISNTTHMVIPSTRLSGNIPGSWV